MEEVSCWLKERREEKRREEKRREKRKYEEGKRDGMMFD